MTPQYLLAAIYIKATFDVNVAHRLQCALCQCQESVSSENGDQGTVHGIPVDMLDLQRTPMRTVGPELGGDVRNAPEETTALPTPRSDCTTSDQMSGNPTQLGLLDITENCE